MTSVNPHNMKINFRRHLFDGSRSSDVFFSSTLQGGGVSHLFHAGPGFGLSWRVRPRADLSVI